MGFLRALFLTPRLLLGRPEKSAESRMGSLLPTPYFLSVFVNVPKRIRIIAHSNITDHMDWSVFDLWILKIRAPRSLQRHGHIV